MGEKGTYGGYLIRLGLLKTISSEDDWQLSDDDHAVNLATGQNAHYDDDKQQWIDSKTGKPVSSSGLGKSPFAP